MRTSTTSPFRRRLLVTWGTEIKITEMDEVAVDMWINMDEGMMKWIKWMPRNTKDSRSIAPAVNSHLSARAAGIRKMCISSVSRRI